MTPLAKYTQTSAEEKRYTIDYADWLDTGEVLSSAVLTVSPTGGLEIPSSAITNDGTVITYFARGGDDGITYKVIVTAQTDGGQVKEDYIQFTIRDP